MNKTNKKVKKIYKAVRTEKQPSNPPKQDRRFRLSVFRSNRYMYAQIIDDENHKTMVAVSSKNIIKQPTTKTETAAGLGELLAKKAKAAKISLVFFDRGKFKYHGRVKALAEKAKAGGLKF